MPKDIQELTTKQKPRALLIDLDGTLLEHYDNSVKADVSMLLLEVNSIIPVSIASGRYQESVHEIASALALTNPQISENGARIFDVNSGRTLYHVPMPVQVSKSIMMYIADELNHSRNLQYLCASGKTIYNERDITPDDYNDITAITIAVANQQAGFAIVEQVQRRFAVATELSYGTYAKKDQYYVVFTQQGVNKGHAAIKLAEILKISASDMVVIGDGPNDISMFAVTKLSIAMGNANNEVKQKAQFVTAPQSQGGLNVALKRLLHLL